jgi:HAD superfamily hydrolase (TIGR01549 family)
MTRKIRAIFFDLDGTLRIPTPEPTAAFVHFARSLQIEVSLAAERRVKIWAHRYWGQESLVKQDMARFDTAAFWVNYSRLLLETVDVKQDVMMRAQLVREWFDSQYKPQVTRSSGSHKLLSTLKQSGYILGLISNRTNPFHDDIASLGLDGFFDLTLAAGEIGCWKPDPQIFKYAVAQFSGLDVGECVYVGDNYYADACGAETAGMLPILYDPEDLYEKAPCQRIRHMAELERVLGY